MDKQALFRRVGGDPFQGLPRDRVDGVGPQSDLNEGVLVAELVQELQIFLDLFLAFFLVEQIDEDGGEILYHWTMDNQPPLETIIFPDESYYNLSGDVLSFNVATECIPEPMTLSLLLIGVAGIINRKK